MIRRSGEGDAEGDGIGHPGCRVDD